MSRINTINRILGRAFNEFEPYIRYIRFPHYKQLFDGERIDFDFPLTVLVGPNGCNKSSVLKALYGCPEGNNTGIYWFSTKVDIIDGRHSYIHGYWSENANGIIEALKTRIHRPTNPDYWEPSRPILSYGMSPMPQIVGQIPADRTETRWKAITKNVKYLDFRSEIGAYDKYFWHGDFHRTETIRTKQDHIRRKSRYLRTVINRELTTYQYYNKEKLRKNVLLSPEACNEVSSILGQEYESVRLIEHSLYGEQYGKTVILNRADLEYSEAFAGSGETSVVVLVHEVMSAPDKSLILLDEPETSIHPKAQKRLKDFLLGQIINKKHQIVISTHSPMFIENLPPEAIKVMYVDPTDKKIRILPQSLPEEAFEVIGQIDSNKLTIYVEDVLTKAIVDVCVKRFMARLEASIDVKVIPGGAGTIMRNSVSGSAVRAETNIVYIFDGDQKLDNRSVINQEMRDKLETYITDDYRINPDTIPEAENRYLSNLIKELVGCDIILYLDGNADTGSNEEQKYKQLRDFLSYWSEHVFYFPGQKPEKLLYNSLNRDNQLLLFGSDFDPETIDWKEYFIDKTKNDLAKDDPRSDEILVIQRQIIAKFPEDCETFVLIKHIINSHFAH